jgi:hypothetical protein
MFDIFFIHFGLLAPKDFKVLGFLFFFIMTYLLKVISATCQVR